MGKFIDLTGQIFNRLTVLGMAYINKHKSYWNCRCNCGKEKIIRGDSLKDKSIQSCGCLRIEKNQLLNTKHGHNRNNKTSKTYKAWNNMLQRCTNSKNTAYKNYGKRKIKVCYKWANKKNGFQNFLQDMGEQPFPKAQIDRINNNKGYYKKNCRWTTSKENNRNRRNNHLIPFKGKELCISEMAEKYNISPYALRSRLKLGWPLEKALTTPVKNYRRKNNVRRN